MRKNTYAIKTKTIIVRISPIGPSRIAVSMASPSPVLFKDWIIFRLLGTLVKFGVLRIQAPLLFLVITGDEAFIGFFEKIEIGGPPT